MTRRPDDRPAIEVIADFRANPDTLRAVRARTLAALLRCDDEARVREVARVLGVLDVAPDTRLRDLLANEGR